MFDELTEGELDHSVIAVNDLSRSREFLRRLGFTTSAVSGHPELGTANSIAVLGSSYIELLSLPDEPGPVTKAMHESVTEYGEGLISIAFKTGDANLTAGRLSGNGDSLAVHQFHRPVKEAYIEGEAHFSVVILPPPRIQTTNFFFCQHHTPELIWPAQALDHPNGAKGSPGIVLVTQEPESLAGFLNNACPGCNIIKEQQVLNCGSERNKISIVEPEYFQRRYFQGYASDIANMRLLAVRVKVEKLEKLVSVLTENEIEYFSLDETRIVVPPSVIPGLWFEFIS